MIYDLHSHSTASDGALTPTQLIERAVAQEVDVLALTDHDGTEGIEEAINAAQHHELTLIAGVEVSVSWRGQTIHIVGLNVDVDNDALQQGLTTLRDYRVGRARRIAEKLDKAGIPGALEGAAAYASETMVGRMHFAQFLVEKGYAKDTKDVFKRFLVRNKPGYVPADWTGLQDAVDWITGAGGQAVIAHPGRYRLTRTKLRRLIEDFKSFGGVGLEVASGSQHPDEVTQMARLTEEFDLLASCGSDFHSPEQHWTELGRVLPLPSSVTPIWSVWG